MELRAAFLAQYFDVDVSTGNFTIAGGFTGVTADIFPAALNEPSYLVLVVDGEGAESDPSIRVDIRLKGAAAPLGSNPIPIRPYFPEPAPGVPTTHNLRVMLKDLVLPIPGIYYFEIYFDDRLVQALRLTATLVGESEEKQ